MMMTSNLAMIAGMWLGLSENYEDWSVAIMESLAPEDRMMAEAEMWAQVDLVQARLTAKGEELEDESAGEEDGEAGNDEEEM